MFKMSKFWEKFFGIFTYITQGSSYLSPRAYAILHRMHHAHSDTEKDPHSPHHSKNIFHMMWKTKILYNDVVFKRINVPKRFEKGYPDWQWLENLGESRISRFVFGFIYVGLYLMAFFVFDMHWAFFLFLPIHFLMGPIHGAIVNWAGHKYGYSNFDNNDKSKNTFIVDFLMMGELFQNNHHKLPNKRNFAVRWWEIDPTYPIMKVLSWVGIIRFEKQKEAEGELQSA